jgi:hypothetical protein
LSLENCTLNNPTTIEGVIDTVVARVLDHLGIPQNLLPRWGKNRNKDKVFATKERKEHKSRRLYSSFFAIFAFSCG